MEAWPTIGPCKFEILFTKCVPHILENIFFSLDYKSYKTCRDVSTTWKELLTSDSYLKKEKSVFYDEIVYEEKLWKAAKERFVEEVQILSFFVDVNCVKGQDQSTPLCEVAKGHACQSQKKVIQLLLKRGAKPNTPDKYGCNSLDWAVHFGNRGIMQLLLDGGADPELENRFGWTPLHRAAMCVKRDCMQLLLDRGANPNKATTHGRTSLHWSALRGNKDVVQLLLERGADPNKADEDGETPLHWAAMIGRKNVVQLLLDRGANPHKANGAGLSPKHFAKRHGHKDVIHMLKRLR